MLKLFNCLFLFVFTCYLNAQTYTVITTNDSGIGSLREALHLANANPGHDTILIPDNLDPINIRIGPYDDIYSLRILDDVTIEGEGDTRKVINGGAAWITANGVLNLPGSACNSNSIVISTSGLLFSIRNPNDHSASGVNITLRNIHVTRVGAFIDSPQGDNIVLDNVRYSHSEPLGNCSLASFISKSRGELKIINSSFDSNMSSDHFAPFILLEGGTLYIDNTFFERNSITKIGDGLSGLVYMFDHGEVEITNSYFLDNVAAPLIFRDSNINITNSLYISHGDSPRSGINTNNSSLNITNSTLLTDIRAKNTSFDDDPANQFPATHITMRGGELSINNSFLDTFWHLPSDFPFTYLSNVSVKSDLNNHYGEQFNTDEAKLSATPNCWVNYAHECSTPSKGSVLIDAANDSAAVYKTGNAINNDVFGESRPQGEHYDIGAVEVKVMLDAVVDSYETVEGITLSIDKDYGLLSNDHFDRGQSVTVTKVEAMTLSAGGMLNVDKKDGSFVYTPKVDSTGTDIFSYQIFDGINQVSSRVEIKVTPRVLTNVSPQTDTYQYTADQQLTIPTPGVMSNDNAGANFTAQIVKSTTAGTLNFNSDGSFIYIPDKNVNIEDSYSYKLVDSSGHETIESVVKLLPVLPTKLTNIFTNSDSYLAMQDTVLVAGAAFSVINNDIYFAPDRNITAKLSTNTISGSLSFNSDGTFIYTPNPGFIGDDSFSYYLHDGFWQYPDANVSITVLPIPVYSNQPPKGTSDYYQVVVGKKLTIPAHGLLTNDKDDDNQPPALPNDNLTAVLVSQAVQGAVVINLDGSFEYQSTAKASGQDRFTYKVIDSDGDESQPVTVTIELNDPVLPSVVMNADHYNLFKNNTLIGAASVIGNDQFVSSPTMTAVLEKSTSFGALTLYDDGSFDYQPNQNYVGDDSFSYYLTDGIQDFKPSASVTLTIVDEGNQTAHSGISTHKDFICSQLSSIDIAENKGLLANDINHANSHGDLSAGLQAELVADVSHGTLSLANTGAFTYQADDSFTGVDSFTYRAKTSVSGSEITSGIEKVELITQPFGCGNILHIGAVDDFISVNKNEPFNALGFNLITNDHLFGIDTKALGLTVSVVKGASHGKAGVNSDGSIFYGADPDYTGRDSFTYHFELNGEYSNTATVIVDVLDTNQAPIANNDSYNLIADHKYVAKGEGSVLHNDIDKDNDPKTHNLGLKAELITDVNNGLLSFNFDGTFTYMPEQGFFGTDSFSYHTIDNQGGISNIAQVELTVSKPVVDNVYPPVALNDHYDVTIGRTFHLAAKGVLVNDYDPDNKIDTAKNYNLSVQLIKTTTSGNLMLNSDGSFTYTTNASIPGSDSFTYKLIDPDNNESNLAMVSLNIVNPPKSTQLLLNADHFAMYEGETLNDANLNLLANDQIPSGFSVTASLLTTANHGMVSIQSDGHFSYTPASGFTGDDTFNYQISDGIYQYTAGGNVAINIVAVVPPANHTPVATSDSYQVLVGETLQVSTFGVLTNDVDADNQPPALPNDGLTAVLISQASQGVVTLNNDGSFSYASSSQSAGQDSFSYQVIDGTGNKSASAIVAIDLMEKPVPLVVLNADHYNIYKNEDLMNARSVIDNDQFDNGLTLSAILSKNVSHGQLTLNSNGSFSYQPDTDYVGDDSFSYYLTDGTHSFMPAAPVTLSIVNHEVVNKVVSHTDHYCTQTGSLSVDSSHGVLSNDINQAKNTGDLSIGLTATLIDDVVIGSLTFNHDGSFNYQALSGYDDDVSFTYQSSTTQGAMSEVTKVTIVAKPFACGNVLGLKANDDHVLTMMNSPLTDIYFNVLSNDILQGINSDTSEVKVVVARSTTHGILNLLSSGVLIYQPSDNFIGKDTFTYYFEINGEYSNVAHVVIDVVNANRKPVAHSDFYYVYSDQKIHIPAQGVLINDVEPDNLTTEKPNAGLVAQLVQNVTLGSLIFRPDGSFEYTPDLNMKKLSTFTYQAVDSQGNTSIPATVILQPTEQPPLPIVLVPDQFSIDYGSEFQINAEILKSNDEILADASVSVELVKQAVHGTVAITNEGVLSYVANEGFVGTDSFEYVLSDGLWEYSDGDGTVNITVNEVDTDGDGIFDHQEPGDKNNNGIPDALEKQGGIKAATKGGTISWLIALLVSIYSIRRKTITVAILAAVGLISSANAVENNDWSIAVHPSWTHLSPEESIDWQQKSKNVATMGLGLEKSLTDNLTASINYFWLNELTIAPNNTFLQDTTLKYSAITIEARYSIDAFKDSPNNRTVYKPYLIVGYDHIDVDVTGEKERVNVEQRNQLLYGLGVSTNFSNNWSMSIEAKRFSKDINSIVYKINWWF